MTIFLLGPSRDLSGGDGPLLTRRVLAAWVNREQGRLIIMEDVPERPEENNLAKFQRIVHEEHVRTFAILVPLRARLHGTSVEIGHLLTRMQDGDLDPRRVHVLLEASIAEVQEEGLLALSEPGNRTRYYADVIDEGCPVHRWTSEQELRWHVAAIVLEDRQPL